MVKPSCHDIKCCAEMPDVLIAAHEWACDETHSCGQDSTQDTTSIGVRHVGKSSSDHDNTIIIILIV